MILSYTCIHNFIDTCNPLVQSQKNEFNNHLAWISDEIVMKIISAFSPMDAYCFSMVLKYSADIYCMFSALLVFKYMTFLLLNYLDLM